MKKLHFLLPKILHMIFHKPYFLLLTVLLSSYISYSQNISYYIDNIAGNNSNNGTSSSTPWADFTNVNNRTFYAGDRVYLKSGCVWNSELRLTGSGTSSNFIIVDSYGGSLKPKIQRNYQVNDRTVYLTDPSYWKIRNLEICNAGDGIRTSFSTKGHSSIYFENLYIHNIDIIVNGSPSNIDNEYYSTGILIYATTSRPSSQADYVAQDIRITDCEMAYLSACYTFIHQVTPISPSTNNETALSFTNCSIDNNYFHNCKVGLCLRGMNNSVFSNNNCKDLAQIALPQGTTGMFVYNVDNVTVTGNIMDGIPSVGSPDQCWIDNEAYCNNAKFFGNVIKNTAGAGVEFLSLAGGVSPPRGSDDQNTNNLVDGNTFSNNGDGVLKTVVWGNAAPSGTAKNNNYLSGNTFFNGNSSGFTQTNNTASGLTSSNLALYKAYSSSSILDNDRIASRAFDGTTATNWQSAAGTFANQWLRINFGTSTTFNSVTLKEWGDRTTGFRIESSNDGINWQTHYTGTTIGTNKVITFSAVSAKMVRIYFTGGTAQPVIMEFEVYNGGGATWTRVNDTDPNASYGSSVLFNNAATNYYNVDGHYTNISGQWGQFAFNGTGIRWIGVKGPNRGSADIYIDGQYTTTLNLYNSTYLYQQVLYENTTLSAGNHTFKSVLVGNGSNYICWDAFEYTGSSGGGGGTNYVQNPSFDVDNFNTQTPTAWSTWSSTGTHADADYTQTDNPHTGARNLAHWKNAAYDVYTYQNITGLTNGTYTATVWAKTINTPSTCFLKVQGYGGADITTNISGSTYTQYTISNIQVTNGTCLIGVYTVGNNGSAGIFDDVTLTSNTGSRLAVNPVVKEKINTEPDGVKVFPNPAYGRTTISYKLPLNTPADVMVYSIDGKLMKRVKINSGSTQTGFYSLDVSNLMKGTYMVEVKTKNYSKKTKLVVLK